MSKCLTFFFLCPSMGTCLKEEERRGRGFFEGLVSRNRNWFLASLRRKRRDLES